MSGIELWNERERQAEGWKRSWVEVRISLPLSTQMEQQGVGVFLRQRDIDQETGRYVAGSCLTGLRGGRVLILNWRWYLGEQERGLRRKDILQAVPLVCVMVPKGCVLVLLTVMIVGLELNSPCQKVLVVSKRHTPDNCYHTAISQHIKPTKFFVLLMDHSAWGKFSNDDTWYNHGLHRV